MIVTFVHQYEIIERLERQFHEERFSAEELIQHKIKQLGQDFATACLAKSLGLLMKKKLITPQDLLEILELNTKENGWSIEEYGFD